MMRIVFICGCLEPGRDGVGDYTRRLAAALIQQGHTAAAVAVNDPHVQQMITAGQLAESVVLPVLRMPPASLQNKAQLQKIKDWIAQYDPEWISLQFVPYAFNRRGLPFFLAKQLKNHLTPGRLFHIMFHEIWIGAANASWKRRLTALLQKRMIKNIIEKCRPSVIHTQLPKTQADLQQFAQGVKPLPLFSNIEVTNTAPGTGAGILRVAFFSQASASQPIIHFLAGLGKDAALQQLKLELVFIGGNPENMRNTGEIFASTADCISSMEYTGFLEPAAISQVLQTCSLGVTIVPRHALGKSGSVAAFLQHGIPVAAPVTHEGYEDQQDIGFFSQALCAAIITRPAMAALSEALAAAKMAKIEIDLSIIAKRFTADLESFQSL